MRFPVSLSRRELPMNNTKKLWASRILAGIVTLALVASATMKIAGVPKMVNSLARAGIPIDAVIPIAILELTCLALYLIPRTTVLGAVLLTGYFGGAIVVHIISHESILSVVMIGVWAWGGIYFRVPGIQGLLPLRRETQLAGSVERAESPDVLASHRVRASRA
jgi:hypothetical protein